MYFNIFFNIDILFYVLFCLIVLLYYIWKKIVIIYIGCFLIIKLISIWVWIFENVLFDFIDCGVDEEYYDNRVD